MFNYYSCLCKENYNPKKIIALYSKQTKNYTNVLSHVRVLNELTIYKEIQSIKIIKSPQMYPLLRLSE